MKRPARVRGKGKRIAAALVTAAVAGSLLVLSSTSKPPTAKLAAQPVSSSPTAAPSVQVRPARATRHAAVAHAEALEKFPRIGPASPTAAGAPAGEPAHAYGCAAALAYLHAHAEPHFTMLCPAPAYNAQGGPAQAMTCVSHPPQCAPNTGVIAISEPCPTAYMNEAANSWIALHLRPGTMDPYGPSC
jgi:hypothetical protein